MRKFLIIVCLLLAVNASAATYYIDFTDGNDNNAGTAEGTAWKTIPGTRNAADNADQETEWGSPAVFSSGSKVPAGTIFRIKPGTTHDSSDGGKILIDSDYYDTDATVENPIKFVSYQAWSGASGSVTFDGTGITTGGSGYGLLHHSQIGGFEWDGEITDGFVVQDSANAGASAYATSQKQGVSFKYIKFYNNQTSISGDDASAAALEIWYHDGGTIDNCEFDGNSQARSGNGLRIGESAKYVIDLTVSNSTAHDFYGTDDGGAGFKALNSQVTFNNCTSYNNYKGFDLGEDSNGAEDITYKIINSTARNSDGNGLNLNVGNTVSGAVKFYVINSIVRDNGDNGSYIYAGPFQLYIVHSIYDNNTNANLLITPEQSAYIDTTTIDVYLYNNIFYKPGGDYNLGTAEFRDNQSNFDVFSDYNSFVQRASEDWYSWGYDAGSTCTKVYGYGATDDEGPGDSSREWYTEYDCSADPPDNCTGHYQADANSVGTGATDTTLPPFSDVTNHIYTLTATYPGTNLSGKGWYISEMGTDKSGVARSNWDMGAYEYQTTQKSRSGFHIGQLENTQ